MALYRLESDRTQIGIDLDTKTRDNNLRHPDYARHAQIMRLVYVQSLLSGQSILQTIPSLADHFPQLDPFNPEHQACVCCIWDAAFDLHRPPHMRIGRTDCAYFFTERAACEYYRNYSGMSKKSSAGDGNPALTVPPDRGTSHGVDRPGRKIRSVFLSILLHFTEQV